MHNHTSTNYDGTIHKSEIFLDMRKRLKEIMKSDPEIVEKAIKDRTIIIKSLKSDIDHRKIAFNEIETRYEEQALIIKKHQDEIKNLKELNEKLTKLNKTLGVELNEANINLSINKIEKEKTLSFKIEKISDKIPGWAGKIIIKMLSSPDVLKYLLMVIFCILFIASFIGWGAIATVIKPLIALFI